MSESESISVLQKWTNSWVVGKTEYMWNGGSDEDLDVVHAALRAVQAALEAANERAERECVWTWDDDGDGSSECGAFMNVEVTPNFCPKCGGKVKEAK